MLLALADTHATGRPVLSEPVRAAIDRAAVTVHAGDFTARQALSTFEDATDRLVAVAGNRDAPPVDERLPAARTVEALGSRVLVVHGHEHDATSLPLLARQDGADLAIVGHTHRPGVDRLGELPVLNPGSHTDPRGNRPAFATVRRTGNGLAARFRTPAGETFERVEL